MKAPLLPIISIFQLDLLVTGTAGNDTLDDFLHSSEGAIFDQGTNDTIDGLGGDDTIFIHNGNDTVHGGNGEDRIYDFGSGNDVMYGDGGNDFFYLGLGNDTADGGAGSDTVSYQYSQQLVALDLDTGFAISEGIDTLVSIENAIGGLGNDGLFGTAGANFLSGLGGNDTLDGRGGNDTLDGGADNDHLIGGAGNDLLIGGIGDDALEGGLGNDRLNGGAGEDTLTGGDGADRFVINASSGFDTITDFQHGIDKIDVSALDARSDKAGNQAFTYDSTPDGSVEEFFDGLDDWGAFLASNPGPIINGDPGEIEYRFDGGYTYVYLSTSDGFNDAALRLEGHVTLSASDFVL